MRVFLINPPPADGVKMVREGRCMQRRSAWGAVWPPISLATIASILEENGFECKIRDCIVEGIDLKNLVAQAREFYPEMMIVNTATGSIIYDLNAVEELKKTLPQSKIFVIGIHPTALPEDTLKLCPSLDGVIRGEPEYVALSLSDQLSRKRDWREVPGVSWREGLFFHHNPSPPYLDLDKIPFPAWHLIKRELYQMPIMGKPFLMLGVSRGCPYQCIFCADATYYGKKLRLKSPKKIVRELDWARTKFGVEDFLFWAESSTLNPKWTMEMAEEIIKSGLKVRFVINSRPDQVSLELLKKLKQAGCWMVGYGLESGSEKILKLMNKGISLEDNKNAVRWAKEAGLAVTGHFVLGFPGETLQTMEDTLKFALSEPIDFAQFYCVVPFPGSRLYELAKRQGWIITDDWSRFEQNYCVLSTPELKAEEVEQFRKKAYQQFYFSPRKMLGILKLALRYGGMGNLYQLVREFQEWMS